MTVRIISNDPGHDALKLLARWIAEAYLEELGQERLKELGEKTKHKIQTDQQYDRGCEASPCGKNQAGK
jgi:hypothetical protein